MPIFDIFSRRQQRAARQTPDVFTYDEIPHPLRVQILHALDDATQRIYERTIPGYRIVGTEGEDCFAQACLVLRRELGTGRLTAGSLRQALTARCSRRILPRFVEGSGLGSAATQATLTT